METRSSDDVLQSQSGAAAAAIESPWATCKPHLGPLATLRRVVADTLYEIPDWRRSTTRWTRVRIPSVTVATVVLGPLAHASFRSCHTEDPPSTPAVRGLGRRWDPAGGLWDHVQRQARPVFPHDPPPSNDVDPHFVV